jgi:class 3 adenylate cyclase/DNA-binding SARP family transcriptional activator/pimeloyl-ACP methyl ester carboxylesterase
MPETRIGTVTIMFTDLEQSTELLQKLGDDQAREVWRRHLGLIREIAASQGGYEVKNLGDGLMVAFSSALDALACSVAIQREVLRHAHKGQHMQVRIGLNVGEPIRTEDDYFGMPVVIAKRICDCAKGGQIVASDLIRRLVGSRGEYVFRDLGTVELKGIAEPFPLCEIVWNVAPQRAQAPIPLQRFLIRRAGSPFVGRDSEMAQLREQWERARGGSRSLVLVHGEPGIGKTRLAAEFAAGVHAEGAIVLGGQAERDVRLPCQPFVEALSHYSAACPVSRLRAQMAAIGPDLAKSIPALAQRLPDLRQPEPADPDTERLRFFDAVSSLLKEMCETRPMVLILDDLHWTDHSSASLLKYIVRSLENQPILILATYREEDLPPGHVLYELMADLRRIVPFQRIHLAGLDEGNISALVELRAGREAPAAFTRALLEQTEGNPLFIEEVLRSLEEMGVISQQDGRWVSNVTVEQMGMPESVREVIERRLSRLSDECSSILAVGSVIGRDFDLESLERASAVPGSRLLELMEEALKARVIVEAAHIVGRYRFSHALFHETLYNSLTTTSRVRLHGQSLLYADNNGVKLAYEVLGASGPHMIAVGFGSSAAVRARNKFLAKRWERFSRHCRLILYDSRGLGFSSAPQEGYDINNLVEDIRAVIDAAGADRVVLWGATDGAPLALTFVNRHPERVAGLILAGATPKLLNSEDFTFGINPELMRSFVETESSDRGFAASKLTVRHSRETEQGNIEVIKRVPQHAWSQLLITMGSLDARPLLTQIRVPTLILHDPQNNYIPVGAAHYMHEGIKDSMLMVTEEYGSELFGEKVYRAIEDFLQKLSASGTDPQVMASYYFERAKEALTRGKLGAAAVNADQSLRFSEEAGSPISMAWAHLAQAHVKHELGQHRERAEHLSLALEIADRIDNLEIRFNALLAEAHFSFDHGDEAAGLAALRKALVTGRENDYFMTQFERPAAMAKLCVKALENEIETAYVHELVARHGLVPEGAPPYLENWPWALKILTLGRFGLVREEKPIRFSRKAQQKPLDMMKALVAFGVGGREVTEEQIADALWPDSEGDMAHKSFATTLHRLRKLAGHPAVFELREGCLRLDQRHCWVDAWAFEETLEQAEAEWQKWTKGKGGPARAISLTQRAIESYRGPFLAGEPGEPWAISARERLQSKFLRAIAKLARHFEEQHEWEQAIECYQKGLEVDDLVEEFYQHLMACLQKLGRVAEAISVYRRCVKTLSASLGIEPSSETEAIHKSLLARAKKITK